ncbi:TIR domain-containing protein [Corallococcus interemptor]|uniref:TIR domain-containing protein n=1 Tax=Corallococcus interemptor TaxID=2316720 RepID=A0A3A8QZN7_9BACT|nr:TIR domain-containing protein [Corallococcus interemptor]RKH74037.1 TIR domain-containing protein [Corallococcus interemptor]
MFHVFLSHSSADKPAVEQIAGRLRDEASLSPFLDKWHLVPGAPWQPALEQALAESETAAVFFGPSGLGPWHHEELQLALMHAVRHRDDFRLIPVLLPGASPEQLSGFLGLRTWVDFRDGLDGEEAFNRLVAGIQGRAPSSTTLLLPDEPAPYRGLLAFDEPHSEYFFGRESDIERTLEKLRDERFVAVVGPSGCGKSSLVLGGVLPRLKQRHGSPTPASRTWTFRPGDRPLRALADVLASQEVHAEQRLQLADALHARFLERPDGLRTVVGSLFPESPSPLILVVDQLEELFTHAPENEEAGEVNPFVANLREAALRGSNALRIIVTLRADFFDRCLSLGPLRELLQDRDALLGGLGDEAFRDVILRPAQKVGAFLEKGLLTTILKDISREPGALPLLEDALDQLWRARRGTWLTLAAYEASGGLAQALQRRAQACYEGLQPEEREVARLLLVRLTSLGEDREDTRRRVARTELDFPGVPGTLLDHVLGVLSGPGARLIVADQHSVELAHEVLIRTWPTLRGWLDEDRRELRIQRRLAEVAGEWKEQGRDASYLYAGARLLDAEELFKHKPALLNQLEREFLEASRSQRDELQREAESRTQRDLDAARRLTEESEARRRTEAEGAAKARRAARLLRNLVAGLSVAILAAAGGSVLLYQEKRVALSRELALSARQNISEDPQRALLLLQEAQRLAPVDNLGEILDAWSQEPCLRVLRVQGGFLFSARFNRDASRILTFSDDNIARLWDASSGKPIANLKGTVGSFSPDGSRILTATRRGEAYLWDTASGKQLFTLQGHSSVVWFVQFSPDGTKVLTASYDSTVHISATASGQLLTELKGHEKEVQTAIFSRDGMRVLTASDDGTARLWDAGSGKQLLQFKGHSMALELAVFNLDESRVLTASEDGSTRIWDARSGKQLASLKGHAASVESAVYSPDGSRIVTASSDGTARIWEASSGKHLMTLLGHFGGVGSATFNSNGAQILTASADGTARIWDVSSGRQLATLQGHTHRLTTARFSPDGTRILTASYDGIARVWDAAPGKPVLTLTGHDQEKGPATFSPDGLRILTVSEDGTARIWDTSSGKPIHTPPAQPSGMHPEKFSPDGSRVLMISEDGGARIESTFTYQESVLLEGYAPEKSLSAFSPDGARLLKLSAGRSIPVWDTTTGKQLTTLDGLPADVITAEFSPDGSRVITFFQERDASVWNTTSGKQLATLEGQLTPSMMTAFSPDGSRLLTTSMEGLLNLAKNLAKGVKPSEISSADLAAAHLWDVSSGRQLVTPLGAFLGPQRAAFSPDDTKVITGFFEGHALLWEAATGEAIALLQGHSQPVTSVMFSPDGAWVLTASEDGTARIWDAATGVPLARLQGHSNAISQARFSPDGTYVLTASNNGIVQLWPSWRWAPQAFARLDAGRELECDERRTFLHEEIECPE